MEPNGKVMDFMKEPSFIHELIKATILTDLKGKYDTSNATKVFVSICQQKPYSYT